MADVNPVASKKMNDWKRKKTEELTDGMIGMRIFTNSLFSGMLGFLEWFGTPKYVGMSAFFGFQEFMSIAVVTRGKVSA